MDESEYNCIDCLATLRIHNEMEREKVAVLSRFDQAMLGPALTMTVRGLRIDHGQVGAALKETRELASGHRADLRAANFKWGKGLAPPALQAIKFIFDELGVYPGYSGKRSTKQEVLTKIIEHPRTPAETVAAALTIRALRDLEEDRKVLERGLSRDGRLRCSNNVAAEVSGRWSNTKDPFDKGANLAAFSRRMRKIVIADDGFELFLLDLEQAESHVVAYLCGSKKYRDMHLQGNVHVAIGNALRIGIGKLGGIEIVPDWTVKTAKATPLPFKPAWSYYDGFKRIQHAGNFGQTAHGYSRVMHCGLDQAQRDTAAYHRLIPELKPWHRKVTATVRDKHYMVTAMGRRRHFLGRTWEESVAKEAIAHLPQSTVSDINKVILWRIWKHLDPDHCQILQEGHDSVLCQVRRGKRRYVTDRLGELSRVAVPMKGWQEEMVIPCEIQSGPSWGEMQVVT